MKTVKGGGATRGAVGEQVDLPGFILGDPALHARFSLAIELIASVVLAAPRSVSTAILAQQSGHPDTRVRSLLRALHRAGLIEAERGQDDAWLRAQRPDRITLADIFCCVADTGAGADTDRRSAGACAHSQARQGVDLLLMQATMAINQIVLSRLRDFDLERLRSVGPGHGFDAHLASMRLRAPEIV